MALRSDCSALESIPLRLMIVAVVAALSVVPASEALETLKTRDFIVRTTMQLDGIVSAAEVLAIQGPGNVRTIHLDFRGGGSVRFDGLCIGDEPSGANRSAVVLTLSNGARMVCSASDPPVCLRSPHDGATHITAPVAKLRLSCELGNASWYVQVESV